MTLRFPFKTLLVTGVLSYVLVDYPPLKLTYAHNKDMVKRAEFYPLSSFPMYSTFSDSPFLVYLTDFSGEKIAIETSLGTHASELKKTYEVRLKARKKEAGQDGRLTNVPLSLKMLAGRETLELLKAKPLVRQFLSGRPNQVIQLHEVVLTAGENGIEQQETLVAEL